MIEKNIPEYLNFWGKARSEQEMQVSMHPVAYHCLDVAAVAEQLQHLRHQEINRICKKFDIQHKEFITLNSFLIALHDIGKFSRTFQGLVAEQWPQNLGDQVILDPNTSHWQLSYELLLNSTINEKLNQAINPASETGLNYLLAAVSGHHGRPPANPAGINLNRRQICSICKTQAEAFLDDWLAHLPPPRQCSWLTEETARELSFWLSGLTNTADWIGSNQRIFKFVKNDISLAEYWKVFAQPQAKEAIAITGLSPATPVKGASLKTIFNIEAPRPMQAELEALVLPDGPVLVVIEDATGSGKTEAATLLAQKMMQNGKGGGLYFALPTMATANAMYQRMAENFRNLFEPQTAPSLALAHGKKELMLESFKSLNMPEASDKGAQRTDVLQSLIADCADWIADDRRKTFFAQIGVGTIDQALMAILPVKFQALRLWALSDRILVIDEAHAYDTYMTKELENLLKFHAVNGSSAIILTATLTQQQRENLVSAYVQGLKKGKDGNASHEQDIEQPSMSYPLVTIVSQSSKETIATIPPASHTIRAVSINRLSTEDEAIAKIKQAAEQGAAVAWVRNAVDDGIRAYELLKAEGVQVDLFHARFIMGDRQLREQDALSRFGANANDTSRAGRVLVATQVIEQSLDLDFDLMLSDLAPIDLLIQRAGRLWRHMHLRPAEKRPIDGPMMHILSPDPSKVESAKWLHQLDFRGRYTYPNHALLWRTAHKLFEQRCINIPTDLRPFLEYVYSDPPANDTPSCLEEYDREAEGNEWGDSSFAKLNILDLDMGYTLQGKWRDDEPTPTRLGETTYTLRLAKINSKNQLEPFFHSKQNSLQSWSLSEIAVRQSMLKGLQPEEAWLPAIELAKKSWPKSQRYNLLVPVDCQGVLLLDYPNEKSNRLVYGPTGLAVKTGKEGRN